MHNVRIVSLASYVGRLTQVALVADELEAALVRAAAISALTALLAQVCLFPET